MEGWMCCKGIRWMSLGKNLLKVGGCLLLSGVSIAADSSSPLWKNITEMGQTTLNNTADIQLSKKYSTTNNYQDARIMLLDTALMREKLALLNHSKIQARALGNTPSNNKINLPLADGSIKAFTLVKDTVLPQALANKYSEIKTFKVLANEQVFAGKVDISATGFHAMLQMTDGEIIFIDPVDLGTSQYAVYKKSAQQHDTNRQHSCGVESFSKPQFGIAQRAAREILQSNGENISARTPQSLINYRIAIATTGEYSAKFGGSVSATLGAITTTINRVNQILEKDLGIHLSLVENNDLLINTDADSDPFTKTKLLDLVVENQSYIDSVLGNANYDIGHLFTAGGGGLAVIGSACNKYNKAKGASGIKSPQGDSFDLDFVAHEIGHQLGATHTFNSSQGACSNQTRTPETAFEPGSGSSIMSYAGNCGLDNIQAHSDAMYHIGSIRQIAQYTKRGIGSHCGQINTLQNNPPTVNAGKDYTIPAQTPFELTGSAEDADNDALIYAWEQLDAGDSSEESTDKGNNALFRVHTPNASKYRSFPPLENVLNHQAVKGETLASYQRKLTMSFVAQDSFNIAQSDEMTVNVVRTGSRFALHYPKASYTRGKTYPIYWNVANTNQAPVNCSSVNIWMSVDGGNNFNYSLANNIPNTGETFVTIPADASTSAQGRFKIKCTNNIFYAISYRNFFLTETDNSVSLSYNNEDKPEAALKDLDLSNSIATTSTSNTSGASNPNNSAGGTFNLLFTFLSFLFFCLRSHIFRFD